MSMKWKAGKKSLYSCETLRLNVNVLKEQIKNSRGHNLQVMNMNILC